MDEMRKRFNKIIAVPFLAAAALVFAPACSEAPEKVVVENELNVLLITIDTLRADHLGCYGYDKPVSRMIDALAARGAASHRARRRGRGTSRRPGRGA